MAKDRAVRRAAREAERQVRIERARKINQAKQKKVARRIATQPSLLLQSRRKKGRTAIFVAIFINALVWILTAEWSMRAVTLVLSLLISPIVAVLVVRERD